MRDLVLLTIFVLGFFNLWSQPANDICETATVIPTVISDQPFVCTDGNNLGALPEDISNECFIGISPIVWFKVTTDGAATLMNINVQSQDFDAPTITLFQQITDCSDLQNVPLTQSILSCIRGSNFEAEAIGSDVGANQVYYIAVGSINSMGGNFTLCVNTISQGSACVTGSEIEIVDRSNGGSLTGPFFPGETVSICVHVNSVTAAGNGCQWFQGLIPQFGNGWDPSSFDANGQPLNATINGNAMGVAENGLYGVATWDWFEDIGFHHDNIFFQVGDLDGNNTLEMCNILYDVDCINEGGINGGCCGPCWDDPGEILPPGWFAYGINGNCPILGHPTVDWGDGNTCGGGMGPWHFCFDLQVRDFPNCSTDLSTMDLTLGFFTTFDGETGAWTGGPSVCALDQPLKISYPFSCCDFIGTDAFILDTISSGESFTYTIDHPDVPYWVWTVTGNSVTGAMPGEGGPGTIIVDTLVNSSPNNQTVTYNFNGYTESCIIFQRSISFVIRGAPPAPPDFDSDGIVDSLDNCLTIYNPLQEDTDNDNTGDACDYGSQNNVGIGTELPVSKLQISQGVVFVDNTNGSLLMRSPDNSCWILRVSDLGVLTATKVPCP